jgi:hypothetical protein
MSLTGEQGPVQPEESPTPSAVSQKKRYVAPALRRLGSVAEMTLGNAGSQPDASTTKTPG